MNGHAGAFAIDHALFYQVAQLVQVQAAGIDGEVGRIVDGSEVLALKGNGLFEVGTLIAQWVLAAGLAKALDENGRARIEE